MEDPTSTAGATSGAIEYPGRISVMEKLRLYRLEGPTLTILPSDPDPTDAAPPALPEKRWLRDVAQVRLRFFPTRVQPNRYECIVTWTNGREVKLSNEEYRGVLNFHDRSAEYCRFVRALSAAVAAENPRAGFVTGRTWLPMILEWSFLGAMLALLVVVLLLVGQIEFHTFVVAKIALVACFVPVLVQYARKNRPRSYDPRAVPEMILPHRSV